MRSSVGCQINSADLGQISEVPDTAGTASVDLHAMFTPWMFVSKHETHSVEISFLKLPELTEKKGLV